MHWKIFVRAASSLETGKVAWRVKMDRSVEEERRILNTHLTFSCMPTLLLSAEFSHFWLFVIPIVNENIPLWCVAWRMCLIIFSDAKKWKFRSCSATKCIVHPDIPLTPPSLDVFSISISISHCFNSHFSRWTWVTRFYWSCGW